jgi:hypothetical protein
MREYAWYCAELDTIVLQIIVSGCDIEFVCCYKEYSPAIYPMSYYCWIPLGEV